MRVWVSPTKADGTCHSLPCPLPAERSLVQINEQVSSVHTLQQGYSVRKRNVLRTHSTPWMDLKTVSQKDRSQTQEYTWYDFMYIIF